MQTNLSYGRVAATTALVLTTLAIVFMLYRLSDVVFFAVLSIIFAAALRAPMLRLEQPLRSRSAAILMLYAVMFVILGLSSYVFSVPLGNDVVQASRSFPQQYESLLRSWQASSLTWQQNAAATLPRTTDIINTIGENGRVIAYQLAGVTYNVFNLLLWGVAVLTLTFYWLVDEDHFARLWLSLLPVQQRTVARQVWFDIEWRVGLFVRSEAVQFLMTIALLWTGFRLLGVPYAALWALYGAIAQLIPWIGIPLMLVPIMPMVLIEPWTTTLAAAVLVLVVGWVLDRVIEPWFGTKGIIHPIVSVLALMVLGEVAGIVGMLIALPLAATVQSLLNQLLQSSVSPKVLTTSATSSQFQALYLHLRDLEARLTDDPEQRRMQEGLLARAAELIDAAEHAIRQRATAPEQRRMSRAAALRDRMPAIFARNRQR
jgi:predicted PurR-regulated permease PerM